MRDFLLHNVSPFPADETANGHGNMQIRALRDGFVLHLLGRSDADAATVEKAIAAPIADLGGELRQLSPGQWFWVGNATLSQERVAEMSAALPSMLALTDQTHGRVRLVVSGPQVRSVLAKGTMIDLADDVFAIGQSAMTQIGHIGAMITRTGDAEFEIMVLRSFAESLWHEIHQMAAEFN